MKGRLIAALVLLVAVAALLAAVTPFPGQIVESSVHPAPISTY